MDIVPLVNNTYNLLKCTYIPLLTGGLFGKHGGIPDLWKQEVLRAGQQDEGVDSTTV